MCGLSDKKNRNHTIKTYTDLIQLLTQIGTIENLDIEIDFCLPSCFEDVSIDVSEQKMGCIKFDDKIVKKFLEEWSEMLSLKNRGTIKNKLYQLWLKDKEQSFNSEEIQPANRIFEPPF